MLYRFRLPDGPVRDERSRRPRHRLGSAEKPEPLDDPRDPAARRAARARRRAPASTTTTKQRNAEARRRGRGDHPRVRGLEGHRRSAAIGDEEILERCIYPMINEGAKILEEGIACAPPTSTSSGSTATAGRSIAAARCSTPTRSASRKRVRSIKRFETQLGEALRPAPLLAQARRRGRRLSHA